MKQNLFDKIYTLIELNVLEPVCKNDKIYLVYLMNDTVESFIVLHNAKMTGTYKPDIEDKTTGYITQEKDSFTLFVNQGNNNSYSIQFTDISLENNYYNYGETGHFWVPGNPLLRRIEFICAIVRDKEEYLGPGSVSPEEKNLSKLFYFPPLQNFPSVPEKYRVTHENCTEKIIESIEVMKLFADGNEYLLTLLDKYTNSLSIFYERLLTSLLTDKNYRFVLDNILAYIKECGQTYNSRDFGDKNAIYNELKNTALRKKAELEGKGQKVHIFYEEPFVLDIDDINFQVILVAENDELYRFRL